MYPPTLEICTQSIPNIAIFNIIEYIGPSGAYTMYTDILIAMYTCVQAAHIYSKNYEHESASETVI